MKFGAIYLFAINLITFILYGYDKHAAINQKWRIPNRVLIGLAAFGGTIGALVGMYTFRHKTKTKRYTLTVPLFLIIQIIAVMLLLSSCGADLAASASKVNPDSSVQNQVVAQDDESEYDELDEEYDDESAWDLDDEDTEEEGQSDAETYEIVFNSNPSRMRYHMPECRGVDDISVDHYQKFELTKEEIKDKQENAGWIPCGWCHPDRKLGIDQ